MSREMKRKVPTTRKERNHKRKKHLNSEEDKVWKRNTKDETKKKKL